MTEEIENKIKKRQEANLQILDELYAYFLIYPDVRFGQALVNLNIIEYDRSILTPDVIDTLFYDESVNILRKVKHTIEQIN